MNCIIRGNNLELTDALKEFIEKKMSRLDKYFDKPFTANVALSVQKDDHRVEVTIPYPGMTIRAEEVSEDMYASVDLVVEKLERQIRKYKTKVNRKLRSNGSLRFLQNGSNLQPSTIAIEELDDTSEIKIVRRKQFEFKPMDPEEAVLQMEMLGHNFFVFHNAETNQPNVIYKRKDGKYGLIEPESE
jgi:putative sigma-54 modulation protein